MDKERVKELLGQVSERFDKIYNLMDEMVEEFNQASGEIEDLYAELDIELEQEGFEEDEEFNDADQEEASDEEGEDEEEEEEEYAEG